MVRLLAQFNCFFEGITCAQRYLGIVFFTTRIKVHACHAVRVDTAFVPIILRVIYFAQITESIIARVSINMIQNALRPFAGYHEPRKSMLQINVGTYSNLSVALGLKSASTLEGSRPSPCPQPSKNSSLGIIMQTSLEVCANKLLFLGGFCGCHKMQDATLRYKMQGA